MAENILSMFNRNYNNGAYNLNPNKKFLSAAPGEVQVDPTQQPTWMLMGEGGATPESEQTPMVNLGAPTQNQSPLLLSQVDPEIIKEVPSS